VILHLLLLAVRVLEFVDWFGMQNVCVCGDHLDCQRCVVPLLRKLSSLSWKLEPSINSN
jgi:hypothetical protein